MNKPEKKDIKDNFVDDCYCKSCRLSETFCQCPGYNQAIDEYEKFLPSEDEIRGFLASYATEKYITDSNSSFLYLSEGKFKIVAKEIAKRIGK